MPQAAFIEVDWGWRAPARFVAPQRRVTATGCPGALAALEAALAGGEPGSPVASCRTGYLFRARLAPFCQRPPPIARFRRLRRWSWPGQVRCGPAGGWARSAPAWDAARYAAAFDQGRLDYIRAGELSGEPDPCRCGALGQIPPLCGRPPRCSRSGMAPWCSSASSGSTVKSSPELFFALDGRGGVSSEARPMKAPRRATPIRARRRPRSPTRRRPEGPGGWMVVDPCATTSRASPRSARSRCPVLRGIEELRRCADGQAR